MYRVLLFIAFLAYCSSAPLDGPHSQRFTDVIMKDDSDIVDNAGAGYAYFKKQDIDYRPSSKSAVQNFNQDMSEYAQSSALQPKSYPSQPYNPYKDQPMNKQYAQQPLAPRRNSQYDVPQMYSPVVSQYNAPQPKILSEQAYAPRYQDMQMIGASQILLPKAYMNQQPKTYGADYSKQPSNDLSSSYAAPRPAQQYDMKPSSYPVVLPPKQYEMKPSTYSAIPQPQQYDMKPSAYPVVLPLQQYEMKPSAYPAVLPPQQYDMKPSAYPTVLPPRRLVAQSQPVRGY